jgi:hypothetical protein
MDAALTMGADGYSHDPQGAVVFLDNISAA